MFANVSPRWNKLRDHRIFRGHHLDHGGCPPSRLASTNERITREAVLPGDQRPSRSALLRTKKVADSINPAFMFWILVRRGQNTNHQAASRQAHTVQFHLADADGFDHTCRLPAASRSKRHFPRWNVRGHRENREWPSIDENAVSLS